MKLILKEEGVLHSSGEQWYGDSGDMCWWDEGEGLGCTESVVHPFPQDPDFSS
jgi:hypothetical protein